MVADHSHERRLSDGISEASNRQLPSLTPLRGIAALWVVLYHYCGTAQFFPNLDITPHSYLISKGYLAVDMFFMLSGFVMAHVYYRAFSESVGQHYRGFLVARIARLYPLHVFILSLFIATAAASQFMTGIATGSFDSMPLTGPRSLGAIVANIFMLQGLAAGQLSWNYPAWSISVEFIAYLALPFALPAIGRAPNAVRVALARCSLCRVGMARGPHQGRLGPMGRPDHAGALHAGILARHRCCTSHSAITGSGSGLTAMLPLSPSLRLRSRACISARPIC